MDKQLASAGMIRIRSCGSSVVRSSQPVARTPRSVINNEYMLLNTLCQVSLSFF